MNKTLLIVLITTLFSPFVMAQYPFSLPENMTATMNINTTSQEDYNNLLLGTNIMGFTTSDEKDFIRRFEPITVRFPHGLFSNWYDWEQDKARVYGTEQFQYTRPDGSLRTQAISQLSTIKLMDDHNLKVGIDGLTSLNSEKKSNTGEGYDMLWTFNMSADGTDFNNGSPVSVARYQDLISRGFQVKAIEMGNECFYPGQRSSIIPNTIDYIKRAKSMSAALKAEDPNIKVSIPLLRKDNSANPNWNKDLAQDANYFDAITVHTYVGADPDNASNSNEAYSTALTARESLRKSIDDYAGKVAPNKPIWLSEWGVKSGGANAVSALGMADCYIFMSQNQDRYERANWFSVNGKLNSFLVWHQVDVNGTMRPRIKYPLEKTAFGSAYEIVRKVLEKSTLLGSTITSPSLIDGVNAVSARAVTKNGKLLVLVLNLTDQKVPFQLNVDGSEYSGSFKHEAMSFSTMEEEKVLPIDSNPLDLVKEGSGQISLPKYSINTILLRDVTLGIQTITKLHENSRKAALKVYPSPVETQFTVSLQGVNMSDVSIYNLNGQLLYNAKPRSQHIRLTKESLFTSGVYILKVIDENQESYSQKLIFK